MSRMSNSAGGSKLFNRQQSPYRPQTTNTNVADKSTIIWKDFLNGVRKRKAAVARLKDAALENINSQSTLKRLLLEVRQITLHLIEDALEIEFRSQIYADNNRGSKTIKLPPISSFRVLEEKEDVFALAEIVTDVDELFMIPNIRVMLPREFPSSRNPFLLGKTVDELAYLVPPHPEPGNVEIELKVLELLRYKRAAKALIRAEAQVLNRLPITLGEVERLLLRMTDDLNLEKLLRCVCALLDNDSVDSSRPAELQCLLHPIFNVEAHELLLRLNRFRGSSFMRVDVQAAVRQILRDCVFDYLEDRASAYLLEWINIVLGKAPSTDTRRDQSNTVSQQQHMQRATSPSIGEMLDDPDVRRALLGSRETARGLTQSNMIAHNHRQQNDDLTSVVSMSDDKGTHEGIFVEPPPLLKMRGPSSPKANTPSSSAHFAPNGRSASPPRQHSTGTSMSQRPNSRQRPAPLKSVALASSGEDLSAKSSVLGNRRIRAEVERVIREMGLAKDVAAQDNDKEDSSMLSSVRFELYKMQQELLRRQVLDPRHYAVSSVDTVNQRQQGLTVVDKHPGATSIRKPNDFTSSATVTVAHKTVSLVGGGVVTLEVVLDLSANCLIGNILRDAFTTDSDALTLATAASRSVVNGSEARRSGKVVSAFFVLSKLMFNRLTQYLFDDLAEGPKPDLRNKMLQNVFDQLEARASERPYPQGKLLAMANRVLFNSVFTEDGVLVDLVILRNDACSGLVIHCTPLAGLYNASSQVNAGPVTLAVQDHELSVLLINQFGLFLLALTKWSSMELVAQWLSSRIKVRKIRTLDDRPPRELESGHDSEGEDAQGGADHKSVNSQVSFDEATHASSRQDDSEMMPAQPVPEQVAGTRTPAEAAAKGKEKFFMMLDISLDRRVEISKSVLLQWKSRNAPNIAGMDVQVRARQDLEMLALTVVIVFPRGGRRPARRPVHPGSGLDSAELTDDDDEEEEEAHEVVLSYRLTGAEIAIFGAAELQDQKKTSVSTNTTKAEEKHPETFIWNIFSRLLITFEGSKTKPFAPACSAYDHANWRIQFNRNLAREVKTVSNRVLVLTVAAIGSELLFEAEPVDSSDRSPVGSKTMTAEELSELVLSEGVSPKLLDMGRRRDLAVMCLDKLKIVDVNGANVLQAHTYPETKMLKIVLVGGGREREQELGSIEINYHFTLSDLRTLIRHELDAEDLPQQFRFLYKGGSCSVRQEPFRRAWECLPRCVVVPKLMDSFEIAIETDDILHRRMKEQGDKSVANLPKLTKGQRRVAGKYVAVPVATLCRVVENSSTIYLLHDSKDLLAPGDILRIGHVTSRDYIVAAANRSDMNSYPKTVKIEPEYDLLEEPHFSAPTQFNFAHPRNAGVLNFSVLFDRPMNLLKSAQQLGLEYELGDNESVAGGSVTSVNRAAEEQSVVPENPQVAKRIKGRRMKVPNQTFVDCWLWRCIPAKDDRRPKWRQMYDDGLVQYAYEHTDSSGFETHFRIPVLHSYLEVLCTDSRCPSMTFHRQRVHEMPNIPLEVYTRLAFERVTDWLPQYKKGVERTKFIKLMKDVGAFPDLKRPARVAQIDMYFQREVKSENGIVQKYITYPGFCRLLQDLSVIRFPPKRKIRAPGEEEAKRKKEEGEEKDGKGREEAEDDDQSSVGVGEMEELVSLSDSVGGSQSDAGKGHKTGKSKHAESAKRLTVRNKEKRSAAEEAERKLAEEAATGGDPIHAAFAFQKFVLDFVMTYADWYEVIWRQAKFAAMQKEAVPYCAATRIAAKHRGGHDHHRYQFFLRNLILLQANIRRKLSAKKTNAFIALLHEDWCLRERYFRAVQIQSLARRFLKRCWYYRVMQKVKEQQVLVQKARRFRLKKLRQTARNGIIYKEAKRVNGVMVFLKLTRKDARNYTKDFGIIIEVYTPHNQAMVQFVLEEPELRTYMMIELGVDAISAGDMLDKRNLQRMVSSRLIIHKPSSKFGAQQVIFSKHALGQRGEKALTKARRIAGEFFVCKIFETGDDVAVQLYHRLSCKIFTCNMTVHDMRAWITEEYKISCVLDEDRDKEPPALASKSAYYEWILSHLAVDTRGGTFKVLFSCHLLKSQKLQMIRKIQSVMRRALVRPRIVRLLDEFMLKVRVSAYDDSVYYVNRKTGASAWEKPRLLGPADLTVQPARRWVQMSYENNGVVATHYVNPFTGQYTHLVPDQAAKIIQAMVRNFLLRAISMPHAHFVKAGTIFKHAANQYAANSTRLAAVINYAMVSHAIALEEDLAKRLYADAVELSEANPLVTRAYAFFMLGTCEPPMKLNRDRAHLLLGDAKRKDEEHAKFQAAYYLFQFACLRRPRDYRTLLNLALVQCVLYDQNHNAEKLLRRALAMAPFEERVMEIWKYLKERFPERQLLYNPQSRVTRINTSGNAKKRMVHGRPVVEDSSWAGWCFVEDDKFSVSKLHKGVAYWYNPADGTESVSVPDFKEQWAVRRNRSQFTEEVLGLEQYYDPLTAEYFQRHALTDTYS